MSNLLLRKSYVAKIQKWKIQLEMDNVVSS